MNLCVSSSYLFPIYCEVCGLIAWWLGHWTRNRFGRVRFSCTVLSTVATPTECVTAFACIGMKPFILCLGMTSSIKAVLQQFLAFTKKIYV